MLFAYHEHHHTFLLACKVHVETVIPVLFLLLRAGIVVAIVLCALAFVTMAILLALAVVAMAFLAPSGGLVVVIAFAVDDDRLLRLLLIVLVMFLVDDLCNGHLVCSLAARRAKVLGPASRPAGGAF